MSCRQVVMTSRATRAGTSAGVVTGDVVAKRRWMCASTTRGDGWSGDSARFGRRGWWAGPPFGREGGWRRAAGVGAMTCSGVGAGRVETANAGADGESRRRCCGRGEGGSGCGCTASWLSSCRSVSGAVRGDVGRVARSIWNTSHILLAANVVVVRGGSAMLGASDDRHAVVAVGGACA